MLGLSPQILILIASIAASAASGWRVTSWYYQAEITDMQLAAALAASEAQKTNRRVELLGFELAGVVSERDAYRNRERDTQFHTVTQEVIKYVKAKPAVDRCVIDHDWLRIANSAARGGVPADPETTGTVNAAPVGVTDDIVLASVTTNYSRCTANRDQLLSLQEWASSLQRLN